MGAPLLLSFDIRAISEEDLAHVYGNPEIIAISQDRDNRTGQGTRGGRRVAGGDLPESTAYQPNQGVFSLSWMWWLWLLFYIAIFLSLSLSFSLSLALSLALVLVLSLFLFFFSPFSSFSSLFIEI